MCHFGHKPQQEICLMNTQQSCWSYVTLSHNDTTNANTDSNVYKQTRDYITYINTCTTCRDTERQSIDMMRQSLYTLSCHRMLAVCPCQAVMSVVAVCPALDQRISAECAPLVTLPGKRIDYCHLQNCHIGNSRVFTSTKHNMNNIGKIHFTIFHHIT